VQQSLVDAVGYMPDNRLDADLLLWPVSGSEKRLPLTKKAAKVGVMKKTGLWHEIKETARELCRVLDWVFIGVAVLIAAGLLFLLYHVAKIHGWL